MTTTDPLITTDTGDDLGQRIEALMVQSFGLRMHLARESHTADGRICCACCGAVEGLHLVAPGWGGVYECRACASRREAGR